MGYMKENKGLDTTIIGGEEVLVNTSVIPSLDMPKFSFITLFYELQNFEQAFNQPIEKTIKSYNPFTNFDILKFRDASGNLSGEYWHELEISSWIWYKIRLWVWIQYVI